MDPTIENCIFDDEMLSILQERKQLEFHQPLLLVLLDISLLVRQMKALGEEYVYAHYLADQEQVQMASFTSEKRKKEWLGGRIVAKYAAVRLFGINTKGCDEVFSYQDLAIISDKNGRPSLLSNKKNCRIYDVLPDISISHSESMVAAMASGHGFCGIDIQKITPKVNKVQGRFCSSAERQILLASIPSHPEKETTALIKLWAAKEALRKVNMKPLPGFLELQLLEIQEESAQEETGSMVYVFSRKSIGRPANIKYRVVITLVKDYVLAFTVRDDSRE